MKYFNSLSDFVAATRDQAVTAKAASVNFSEGQRNTVTANSNTQVELPKEGLSAILSGHHVYAMLQLRPRLTTSSSVEDRRRNISLIADLVQGARNIAHQYDGALLEAQGPVVHIFLPEDVKSDKAQKASVHLQAYINGTIKEKAGDDFLKSVVAFSHGPTILVSSEDSHGDQSIVSLAPAANAPAKVLWKNWESLPNGSILDVDISGKSQQLEESERKVITASLAESLYKIANSRQDVMFSASESSQRDFPTPESPDSPTVQEPQKAFSISFRADMEGFTANVSRAFEEGEDAVKGLALEFHGVMSHARGFCKSKECVHLPWAGDCFNLLLSFSDREDYSEAKKRRILTTALDFTNYMESAFPTIGWAFSMAGGDLEAAQSCNTLVSRVTIGHTTLLLATGLPVEKSLQGLVRESPDEGNGVIWKQDAGELDEDLRSILEEVKGGENHRHFNRRELENAQEKFDFLPSPAPYQSNVVTKAIASHVPFVKPYFK